MFLANIYCALFKSLQESFAHALVAFLKRRCPQLYGMSEKELPKAVQLPPEIITTTLTCLQLHMRLISIY